MLTTDGDRGRPLVANEQGHWLRGDIVGLLCARELSIKALAVPVSCKTAIEACGAFDQVVRTSIGSPYVLAAMEQMAVEHERVAGFETSSIQECRKRLEALPAGCSATCPHPDGDGRQ